MHQKKTFRCEIKSMTGCLFLYSYPALKKFAEHFFGIGVCQANETPILFYHIRKCLFLFA